MAFLVQKVRFAETRMWVALSETVSVEGLLADCDDITFIVDDMA